VKLGHVTSSTGYAGRTSDRTIVLVMAAFSGSMASHLDGVNWPAVGVALALFSVTLFILVQIIKPALRSWRMKAPCNVHFTILPLQQVKLEHVLQDDLAHHVAELVLPPNSLVEIEIEILPKLSFHEESFSFGCEGADDEKPFAVERFDRLIEIGKNRWLPGQDDDYSFDRHKYFRVSTKKKRSKRSRIQLGLKLQTRTPGVYPANLFFFTDEGTGKASVTIRVEDRPRTPMRCSLHWGCYVRPLRVAS
jgi:hypothetical protein